MGASGTRTAPRNLAFEGSTGLCAHVWAKHLFVLQMANSAEVLNYLLGHPPAAPHEIAYNFLVPNLKGLENLIRTFDAANLSEPAIDSSSLPTPPPSPEPDGRRASPGRNPTSGQPFSVEISIFAAATEAFSKANTNCTIAESLERFKRIVTLAKTKNLRVRGYVSVALGCPFEGPNVSPSKVAEVTASLLEMGADEVSVADTTGMGTAPRTREMLKALSAAGIATNDLALHFHDTYGQALVNTVIGLEHGIRTFDSSVGGLGGCPYSKGATGNISTEDLVYCLHSLGAKTGIDLQKMAEIGAWITSEIGRPNEGRAGKALLARLSS
jgi:hydroxymethylglutaryl-CoA lyase